MPKKPKTENRKPKTELIPRPPIVTLMGHIDHGKTTLLDFIRKTELQKQEAGGITQSIGAYQIEVKSEKEKGKKITFIDTPGHEAFTTMRARGGKAADIVVLVVAANAGVQPQTIEAINHAKAAKVPIIVAINKMDLPEADAKKVKNELAKADVLVEDLGGDAVSVEVSAKTGKGIDELLEMLLLVAEMQELKANPEANPEGTVIESFLDKQKGPVAPAIVTNGTLKTGQVLVVGKTWGKVKSMVDWQRKKVEKAGPSTPVEILGLKEVPLAGERFEVVDKSKLSDRLEPAAPEDNTLKRVSPPKDEKVRKISLIIKADTQGSLEAIRASIKKLESPELKIEYIHQGIGQVIEADVMLAATTGAKILGFRVGVDKAAKSAVKLEKVQIKTYEIIYRLLEDIQEKLAKKQKEGEIKILGKAKLLKVFTLSDGTKVAGCKTQEGTVAKGDKVRIIRDNKILHEAKIVSLKHEKEKISKAEEGMEFGMAIEPEFDFEKGDIVEAVSQ